MYYTFPSYLYHVNLWGKILCKNFQTTVKDDTQTLSQCLAFQIREIKRFNSFDLMFQFRVTKLIDFSKKR